MTQFRNRAFDLTSVVDHLHPTRHKNLIRAIRAFLAVESVGLDLRDASVRRCALGMGTPLPFFIPHPRYAPHSHPPIIGAGVEHLGASIIRPSYCTRPRSFQLHANAVFRDLFGASSSNVLRAGCRRCRA